MKQGFTIIELMIAILISSTLSLLLLSIIGTLAKMQVRTESITIQASRAEIAFNMLERDLLGIFLSDIESKNTPDFKNSVTIPSTQSIMLDDTAKEKIDSDRKNQQFSLQATQKNNNLDHMLFVTTNPAIAVWNSTTGKPKTRYVKIDYALMPDPNHKESFLLTRQEEDLSEKSKGKAFELINGIRNFTIKFYYTSPPTDAPKDLNIPIMYNTTQEWGNSKNLPTLPAFISLNFSLWDSLYKNNKNYIVTIQLPVQEAEKKPMTPLKEKPNKPAPLEHSITNKTLSTDKKNIVTANTIEVIKIEQSL